MWTCLCLMKETCKPAVLTSSADHTNTVRESQQWSSFSGNIPALAQDQQWRRNPETEQNLWIWADDTDLSSRWIQKGTFSSSGPDVREPTVPETAGGMLLFVFCLREKFLHINTKSQRCTNPVQKIKSVSKVFVSVQHFVMNRLFCFFPGAPVSAASVFRHACMYVCVHVSTWCLFTCKNWFLSWIRTPNQILSIIYI